jgi:hypothetical protein
MHGVRKLFTPLGKKAILTQSFRIQLSPTEAPTKTQRMRGAYVVYNLLNQQD